VRKEERRCYYLCGEQEQEMKIKTKYDFNIKNGVCMCVNQINQSIVGHNNIYYEHDDDCMVWYGMVWYMA